MRWSVLTSARALVACWAVPQIIWLATVFWYHLVYSPAILSQYANDAPLATDPGPGWIYAVSFVSFLLSIACPILVLVVVLNGAIRIWRLMPARSPWPAAWAAVSVAALAAEAAIWVGQAAWFPGWHWPLALAVGIAAVAVAMIWVLRRAHAAHCLTPIPDTNEPGSGWTLVD